MLTDAQMDAALAIFQQRMQEVADLYYEKMGRHIREIGRLVPSDVHRLQQLRRMNANLRDVKRRLARAAGLNLKDLETVLQEAAKVDNRVAAKILGVSDAQAALRNNVPLQRALRAQYAETAGRLSNLSNSTIVQDAYRKAVDSAVTAVQSGAEDYESAIRRTLTRAGEMGLRVRESGTRAVEYASGNTRRVDTAVRMNVLDAMRRMNQRTLEEVGRQFGADGVEIDAHMLCAEDHLPYQGQQYSNEEFEDIQDSLSRPFGEWNCRHTWHPILMGISPRAYTDDQLDEMRRYSTEEVEIDGRTKTRYEWSQEMRRMETAIRQQKDTATLARYAGDDALRRQCQGSINTMVKEYERLSDRTGLGPDFRRTYVAGFKDAKVEEAAAMARHSHEAVGQWPAGGRVISKETLADLKTFAAERGVRIHGFENFDGDVELVKSFIRGMDRVAQDYPEVKSWPKSGLQLWCRYNLSPSEYAETKNTTIHINCQAFRSKEALQNDYASSASTGFFVKGTEYESIAYHEMGHVIYNAFHFPLAEKIVRGLESWKLSEYATKSDKEFIAEAYSATYSEVNTDVALTLRKRCDRIVSERRRRWRG